MLAYLEIVRVILVSNWLSEHVRFPFAQKRIVLLHNI